MADKTQLIRDVVKEILFFVFATLGAFAYVMVVELIISFLALNYIQMNIERMVVYAVIGAVLFDIYYVIRKVRKHKGLGRKNH